MGGWRWVTRRVTRWVTRRLGVLFRKADVEQELDEEVRFHIEMEVRRHVEAGMDPREARRRALIAFGGVERHKEEVRDVRGARILDDLVQDVRVSLRSLPKQPVFLISVLVTLGIGIGGCVAMFGVMERSLFQALPFPDSDRLVMGRVTWEGRVGRTVSGPDFFDYRARASYLAGLSAFTPYPIQSTVTGPGGPERVQAPGVSVGYFRTLGVDPVLGRHFLAEEGEPGAEAVTILSHGYWQRRFGGDPSVVGSTVNLDGAPTTIVGVMPASFRFFLDADLWWPIQRNSGWASARQFHNFVLVGRLADDATVASAQAEVDAISAALAELYPATNRDKGLNLTHLGEALSEQYRPRVATFAGAVAVLLLIACANVASLILARGSTRRGEMAVRSVMGAGRGRLARQLVTENVILALGAGFVGVLLAIGLQRGILTFLSFRDLSGDAPELSGGVLAFAAALSLGTVLVFGVLPSLRVARSDAAVHLRGGTRIRGSRRASRFRNTLVVGQVAGTAVLLVVSGLLIRSFAELRGADPGFDPEGLVTAEIALPRGEYREPEARILFFTELQQRLLALPAVSTMATTSHLPILDPGGNVRVDLPERFGTDGVFGLLAYQRSVMPGYFSAMAIPLVRGRDVEATDDGNAPEAVVLSEDLAERIFGSDDPIGRTVAVDVGGDEPDLREVIGVVGDVLPGNPADGTDLAMYYPYHQSSAGRVRIALRTRGEAAGVVGSVREELRSLDPDVPLSDVVAMDAAIDRSLSRERALAIVLALFASVAVLLAAVGLYGVLAYRVSHRMHEIGVRLALGAPAARVSSGIVLGGLTLVGVGLALGIPGAYVAGRLLQSMLFGVGVGDPLTYLGVTGFLGLVAGAACLFPARRAARIDPVQAFRAQ